MADDFLSAEENVETEEDDNSFNLNKFGFNLYKYLTSRTKENITFQDRELMLGIIKDVDRFKNKKDVKFRDLFVKYHAYFVAGVSAVNITMSVVSAIRKDPDWVEGLLYSLNEDALMFLLNRYFNFDNYRGLKKVLKKYGLTPNQFYRIITNKKLMDVLLRSSYVTMYENDPFQSFLFAHNEVDSILSFISYKSAEGFDAHMGSQILNPKKFGEEESNRLTEFVDYARAHFKVDNIVDDDPLDKPNKQSESTKELEEEPNA